MEGRRSSRTQVGRLRRQRSSEWREYSTSEEEAAARQTAVYAAGIASLLAGYPRSDGYGDGEEGSPTLPSYRSQGISPTRQASPYPIEASNLTSGGSTPNPSISPRFGRSGVTVNGHGKKSSKSNTLGGRSRASQGSKRGVTSSSSMSSASSDNLHKDLSYERRHADLEEAEVESPPEPAPPEVPPRGPSLQHPLQQQSTLTLHKHDPNTYVFPTQEYVISGSPRSYTMKSPEYMNEMNGTIQSHRLNRSGSPDYSDPTATDKWKILSKVLPILNSRVKPRGLA